MPIIIQRTYFTREQIRAEPDALFAWGDNLKRAGGASNPKSGQAYACRGEPNTVGIPTKHYPANDPGAFFRDSDFDIAKPPIDLAFIRLAEQLHRSATVYWPADGIGTGRARLEQSSPRIWRYLEKCKARLFDLAPVIER